MTRAQMFDSAALTCENDRTAEQSGTGQCANTDPLLDRINLGIEGSGPMAIVPAADSSDTPPPDYLIARRMARVDGCPTACGNYETPSAVYDDPPRGLIGNYICLDCGHAWSASWSDA